MMTAIPSVWAAEILPKYISLSVLKCPTKIRAEEHRIRYRRKRNPSKKFFPQIPQDQKDGDIRTQFIELGRVEGLSGEHLSCRTFRGEDQSPW